MTPFTLAYPTGLILLGLLAASHGAMAQEVSAIASQHQASASAAPSLPYETLLRNADALIKNGNPDEAYLLLEPYEFEYSGLVQFDYLLGIAALDSGRPDMATWALERVLSVNPEHASARLDIARAYYQLSDFPRARTEFSASLKQATTPAARASIQKYLDAIASKINRTSFTGYFEIGAGRDSNVNNATNESSVYIDSSATTATLDTTNVKAPDNYYALVGGGEIAFNLNVNWGLYAGVDLRKQVNLTQTQFDSLSTDLRTGLAYKTQSNQLLLGLISGKYDLNGARNNDSSGFKAEWRHVFSPSNQVNGFAQSMQYRYVDPLLKPNDIDQQAVGLDWQHVFSSGASALYGSLHYGTEKDVSPVINAPSIGIINPSGGRNDGAKQFRGFRIGGQLSTDERTTVFANAGLQTGNYGKVNYLFLRKRQDQYFDVKLGLDWKFDRLLTLRPQLVYTKNDSNIPLYSYDSMDVSLTVRRDFR